MRPIWPAACLFLVAALLQSAAASPVPQRIVSMSPHYTSILYDIGAQDRLVGVTDYCRYPPEAQMKEKVGGFLDPNLEKVVQLRPDLVLMLKSHGEKAGILRKLGLNVLVMDNERLEDVWRTYDTLGKALGMGRESRAAKKRLQARLSALGKKAPRSGAPPTALFVVGKEPGILRNIIAAGPGTFPDELMRLAGLRNILSDSKVRYPMVSQEQILARDPDLILQAPFEGDRAKVWAVRELRSWREWGTLKAVRNGRVFILTRPEYLVPGPGVVGLAEYLHEKAEELSGIP